MATLRKYEKGEGKDWNTKESIAFGRGDVHKDFMGLQKDLNDFASALGFAKLDVDGFLGPKSVAAFNQIYDAALKKNPLLAANVFPPPKTKEDIAEYCQFMRQWLNETGRKVLLSERSA
jgi:lysozyme family protein